MSTANPPPNPPQKPDISIDIYTGVKILWGLVFLILLVVLIFIYVRTRKEIARLVINTRTHSHLTYPEG